MARFSLHIANALWPQDGYPFESSYLDTIAVNYGAGLFALDYASPEAARGTINAWTSDQTQGRIPELIPSGAIDGNTRMVLTNAIYFKAPWASEFRSVATKNDTFHTLGGTDVTVPMMSQPDNMLYAEGEGYRMAEFLYEGGEVTMTLVLPDEGQLSTIESGATGAWLKAAVESERLETVVLTMPKFEFRTTLSLKDVLAGLRESTDKSGTA